MDLYFSGGEQPTLMKQLLNLDVTHIVVSFYEWQTRHAHNSIFKIIPPEISVCVVAGVARKQLDDWEAFADGYVEFCQANAEYALIYDMDAPNCPERIRKATRSQLAILADAVVFPFELGELSALATKHERVGINARMAKSLQPNEMRRLSVALYGSNITDPRTLRAGRFTASTTSTWFSPTRFGELWVWSRGKLVHFKDESRARGVRQYAKEIEEFGVDPLACLNNDKSALVTLAVRSLQTMAESLSMRRRDQAPGNRTLQVVPDLLPTEIPSSGTNPQIVPIQTEGERRRETILGITLDTSSEHVTVASTGQMLRMCDTCYLSDTCTRYEIHASCAFELPVRFTTQVQWDAACTAILEMEFQRIAEARFGEQLQGGGLEARVGQEMDRFFRLLAQLKELNKPIETQPTGVLTRILQSLGIMGGAGEETDAPGSSNEEDPEPQRPKLRVLDVESWAPQQEAGEGEDDQT
jgi:hypothetical protein